MLAKKFFFSLLVLCFFLPVSAQNLRSLPRSTPEAEGVSSKAIAAFLDSVAVSKHEFHSFMLVRHGKVIAEGWWKPYGPDLGHTLYSLSKSFTATAVGFARAEGKLSLADKVVSFFSAERPDSTSAFLQQLTIKDLLTMSVGQVPDPTGFVVQDSNWVKRFLALPIKHQPGSKFLYNSMATYMLSAIVQKVTGEKVIDYLRPRLFEPLGITNPDWETDLKGINTGGWGLRLKTEDIAKFAQLFLQKGKWNGRQVLPKGWTEEASTAHIIQHPEFSQAKRDSSDWEQGYGYQMWRCRNGAYRGDGAFGQYAIVMPEQDAVIAITSETSDMQGELNLIWKVLLPAMQKGKLPANSKTSASLKKKIAGLSLPATKTTTVTDTITFTGKTFRMEPNIYRIQSMGFAFRDGSCELQLKTDTANYVLRFGPGNWHPGQTSLHGPYLVSGAKNKLAGLAPFQVAGSYHWAATGTLNLALRYIQSPHTQNMECRFDGETLSVQMKPSFAYNATTATVTLKGKVQ